MSTAPETDRRLVEWIGAALDAGWHSTSRLVAVTVPAPTVPLGQVFSKFVEEPAYYFAKNDHGGEVGIGSVASFTASELTELPTLETAAQCLLEHPFEVGLGAAARPPRLYGGIANACHPGLEGQWQAFPRIQFDLSRFRYLSDGHNASLTLHLLAEEVTETQSRSHWSARAADFLVQLVQQSSTPRRVSIRTRNDRPDKLTWKRNVENALGRIRRVNNDPDAASSASLEKVVLAREVLLELDSEPQIAGLLENLNAQSPGTTRFAFRKSGIVFLGATPERLILRLGSELRTEAVAGSIRALDTDAADILMRSEKERHEHELVVRELVRKLESLGARPEIPSHPSVRQLRHVLHLATPITARLFGPPHILTLVSSLHPTPAVCGVPESAAAEFIRQHEGFDRGWYAAPIGWFDALGDGEFVVGLRSGLLEGKTLRLYAGAGIVRDSEPDMEFQETELKLMSLLDALGAQPCATSVRAEGTGSGPAGRHSLPP